MHWVALFYSKLPLGNTCCLCGSVHPAPLSVLKCGTDRFLKYPNNGPALQLEFKNIKIGDKNRVALFKPDWLLIHCCSTDAIGDKRLNMYLYCSLIMFIKKPKLSSRLTLLLILSLKKEAHVKTNKQINNKWADVAWRLVGWVRYQKVGVLKPSSLGQSNQE